MRRRTSPGGCILLQHDGLGAQYGIASRRQSKQALRLGLRYELSVEIPYLHIFLPLLFQTETLGRKPDVAWRCPLSCSQLSLYRALPKVKQPLEFFESVPIAPAREEEKPKLDDNHIRDVCRTRQCTVAVPERCSRWSRVHHRCCIVRRAEA